jgi:hypothetical protein
MDLLWKMVTFFNDKCRIHTKSDVFFNKII